MAQAPSRFSPTQELTVDDVLAAIRHIHDSSIEAVREEIGASKSQKYFLLHDDNQIDAKVVIHLAWNLRYPERPIGAADFRGDARHVAIPLRELGFDVVEIEKDRRFGEIPGYPPGTTFVNREELSTKGVHRPVQAGICGGGESGAESIVVSGGYIDDEDFGDTLTYTGHGGNDPATGRQIADQELTRGNLALAFSCDQELPVRVIRGSKGDPAYSPAEGYRYDGLFKVVRYWPDTGRDGYRIWRFNLTKLDTDISQQRLGVGNQAPAPDGTLGPAARQQVASWRVVRKAQIAEWVKKVHNWTCQFCSERISTPAGAYAEAAHIRPLGSPHNGSDHASNLLCLCPNCHKRFDTYSLFINEADEIVDSLTMTTVTQLRRHIEHVIDVNNLAYHRTVCEQLLGQKTKSGQKLDTSLNDENWEETEEC